MGEKSINNESLLKAMGTRIGVRRRELHLTQEQVAERMGVSLQMVSNLELGKKAIRPENLVKLCEILSVSADFVLLGRCSDYEASAFAAKYAKLSGEHQRIIAELIDSLIG